MPKSPKQIKKKDPPASPKGMRDLVGDDFYKFQGLFERAQEIAVYYDFKPIETPILEHEEIFTSGIGAATDIVEKEMYTVRTKGGDHLVLRPEGTAAIMRAYLERGMMQLPQPVMLYYGGPFFRHERPQRGRYRELYQFGLEIIGTEKSIADAIIIRMMMLILAETGLGNLFVRINSIGDKESRPEYIRALTAYYKKNVAKICIDCKQRLKTNPLRLLDCKNPECRKIKSGAPETLSYLSASGKQHFKEVLEYLDGMNIDYEVDTTLVRGIDYYTHTVFEFFSGSSSALAESSNITNSETGADTEGGEPTLLALGGGGRYDYLARSLGSKKDIEAVGASIGMDRVIESPNYQFIAPKILKKPKVYFIQLGFEAKLKSLQIIEILRKARIPTTHALSKDKLSAQLGMAEKMNIPYVLILGQREAIEGTVIVRNMQNRSQDTVKIEKLAEYVKNHM